MTIEFRTLLVCSLVFMVVQCFGCGGGHEGCRPNPSVTADMAALGLPAPDGGKLCHAEAKYIMYDFPKDRSEVLPEFSAKLEKAGWKEIANPANGKSDGPSLFFEKNGKQIMYTVEKCHRSFLADLSGSCSTVTFDDVTK